MDKFYRACAAIFLAVTFASMSTACPNICNCQGSMVNCAARGLTTVPKNIPSTTEMLDLSGNSIRQLSKGDFTSTPKVKYLFLQNTGIEELSAEIFSGLNSLRTLNLTGNKIREIPPKAFTKLTGPVECQHTACVIDLTRNPLGDIRGYSFRHIRGFRVLLGDSDVPLKFHGYAFADSSELPLLSVVNVPQLSFEPGIFTSARNVTHFNFESVTIPTVGDFQFKDAQEIKSISFTNCRIQEIQRYAFSGSYFIKDDAEKSLIVFKGCLIKTLSTEAFKDSSVQSLIFKESDVTSMQSGVFTGMPHVEDIIMENCILGQIPSKCFSRLQNVKSIVLHGSKIRSIESNAFHESTNIGRISIGKDKSTPLVLKSGAFTGLDNLEYLYIGEIPEITIESGAFKDLVDVKEFNLEKTKIGVLQNGALGQLMRVRRLNIREVLVVTFGGESSLDPMAIEPGIITVTAHKVRLPCDCSTKSTYLRAKEFFGRHQVHCSNTSELITPELIENMSHCTDTRSGAAGVRSEYAGLVSMALYGLIKLTGYFN